MNHLQKLLSRLKKVRGTGKNKWQACCPAHDDHDPSLDIKIGDKGQILICCRAHCENAAVLAAVGLDFADLYPPDSKRLQSGRPPLPGRDRPGSDQQLRDAIGDLFMLVCTSHPLGTPERELALDALKRANDCLSGGAR